MVEEKIKSEAVSFGIGLLVIIIAEAIIGILSPDGILGIIVFLGLSIIVVFLVWYFYWVPRNIFGTFPDSGFDTPLEKGKTLVGQVTACSNHDVDPLDGTLKKKRDIKNYSPRFNIAGAVPFWWPIIKVRPTKLKYGKNIPIKTGEPLEKSVEIKETVVNKVSLKWYPFGILTDWVEISGNARAMARITWVGRLLNYEDANINNTNVIMTISNEIINQFRRFSADMEFNDLKKIRDNDQGSFQEMLNFIQGLARIYGMEIKTIMMTDVELHPEDQSAFRKQLQAQKDAEARITSAKAESEVLKIMGMGKQQARALETMGAVTHQISLICGITPEQVPAMMNDPEFRKLHDEEMKAAFRFVEQTVSADAGALIHFLTSGAQSTGGSGTNLGGFNSEAIAYIVGLIKALNMPAANGQSSPATNAIPKASDYRKTQSSSNGSRDQMDKYTQMSKDPNSGYYGIHPDDIRDYEKAMRKANKNTGDSENKKPEPKLSDEQREALEEKGLLEDL